MRLTTKTSRPRTVGFGLVAAILGVLFTGPTSSAADKPKACVPGKTKKIAFLMKQSTAYRYLHADMPFFVKTAEAAGFKVITQSAENDAMVQVSQASIRSTFTSPGPSPRRRRRPAFRWPRTTT
jgi:ABC-type sugar transport system substrate-binding protein